MISGHLRWGIESERVSDRWCGWISGNPPEYASFFFSVGVATICLRGDRYKAFLAVVRPEQGGGLGPISKSKDQKDRRTEGRPEAGVTTKYSSSTSKDPFKLKGRPEGHISGTQALRWPVFFRWHPLNSRASAPLLAGMPQNGRVCFLREGDSKVRKRSEYQSQLAEKIAPESKLINSWIQSLPQSEDTKVRFLPVGAPKNTPKVRLFKQ